MNDTIVARPNGDFDVIRENKITFNNGSTISLKGFPSEDRLIGLHEGLGVSTPGVQSYHAIVYDFDNNGWPKTKSGQMEMLLLAASLKRPVYTIWNAIGSALCSLIIVLIASLVASFVSKQ